MLCHCPANAAPSPSANPPGPMPDSLGLRASLPQIGEFLLSQSPRSQACVWGRGPTRLPFCLLSLDDSLADILNV
ncbi:hypothetical protein V2G26_015606 [Clonostachys chloroleuca]